MPEPEYDFVQNFVCLTIRFKTPLTPYVSGDNVSQDETLNETLSETLKKALEVIKLHPGIKRKELVDTLGLAAATVSRHIAVLTEKGYIERRGSKKSGGYYAIKG